MVEAAASGRKPASAAGDRALIRVGVFWFAVAVLGQLAFAAYIAAFYGGAALGGDFERWNEVLVGGYVAGGTAGNVVLASHLLLAFVITVGGPLQLIPALRRRFPAAHRWNGRLYLLTAVVVSLGGLYMVWTRGVLGPISNAVAISINGLLIIAFAGMALRHALARRFDVHRQWATRLFLAVSGVWFFRIGMMAWILANQGPVGLGDDFDGPFVRFWAYGCYLLPLAVLELYLRARDNRGPLFRWAMVGALSGLALVTALGVFGAAAGMWLPRMGG